MLIKYEHLNLKIVVLLLFYFITSCETNDKRFDKTESQAFSSEKFKKIDDFFEKSIL